MLDIKEYSKVLSEKRGVIVLYRNSTPTSSFEKSVEVTGYDHTATTKSVTACISNEIREHFKNRGFVVTSIDLNRQRVEYQYDFFGTPIEDFVNFRFYTKSTWEAVKREEHKNIIENGDAPYPEIIIQNLNQLTMLTD